MVCFRLKRHVLNCFIFSDYDSLRDVRKKNTKNDRIVNIDKEKYEIGSTVVMIVLALPCDGMDNSRRWFESHQSFCLFVCIVKLSFRTAFLAVRL
jgi:hypothetical protein